MWTDGREAWKFWMELGGCGYKCERSSDVALSGAESSNRNLDVRDTVQCPASAGQLRTRTQTDLIN
jgi:hypothetical protein